MADGSIAFMLTMRAVFPIPPNGYHYELIKMEDACAIEAGLRANQKHVEKRFRKTRGTLIFPDVPRGFLGKT